MIKKFLSVAVFLFATCLLFLVVSSDKPEKTEPAEVSELQEVKPIIEKEPEKISIITYQDAIEEGKRLEKNVLVIFSASWCHWCGELKKTLSDSDVEEALKEYIVYNADLDEEKELGNKYGVRSIPAYVIIDPNNEKVLKQGSGYKDARNFKAWLKLSK